MDESDESELSDDESSDEQSLSLSLLDESSDEDPFDLADALRS